MNVERVVRETLHEMSAMEGVRVPGDFADRVLRVRRTRRFRKAAAAALGTVAVLVAALLVPALDSGSRDRGLPAGLSDADVVTDLGDTRPQHQVAAGDTALSAYYTLGWGPEQDSKRPIVRTWYLLNTSTGRYEKTPWAYIDVARGLKTAAVLEGPLPAKRVGLVDMSTGKVTRWINLGRAAGGVSWSPQGDKLAVTTSIAGKPSKDGFHTESADSDIPRDQNLSRRFWDIERTGYYVVDPATGASVWRSCPLPETEGDSPLVWRMGDAKWSRDGSLIKMEGATNTGRPRFYDLQGRQRPAPAGEDPEHPSTGGVSPNGRLVAGDNVPMGNNITEVLNSGTGHVVETQPVDELVAWADDQRVIAWQSDSIRCTRSQYCQRLVVVDIDGDHMKPLTAPRTSRPGQAWEPVFTHR
ncbi:hypothetical protein ACFW3D_18190 [Streptomyces sp. NPDC058864]